MRWSVAIEHSRPFRATFWPLRRLVRAFRESEDGQAVVELALALPVLLIIVLGIVDFGRAINYWNDQTHIANLGARYAATGSWPESCEEEGKPVATTTLVAYIKCQAFNDSPELTKGGGSSGIQGGIKVCVSAPKPEIGQPVTVSVASEYKWLPYPKVLGGSTTSFATSKLVGKASMRLEQAPTSQVTQGSESAAC
jgi:hypothetical protein